MSQESANRTVVSIVATSRLGEERLRRRRIRGYFRMPNSVLMLMLTTIVMVGMSRWDDRRRVKLTASRAMVTMRSVE